MKFQHGQIVATATVNHQFSEDVIRPYLHRHLNGDWGNLDPADAALNDAAIASDLAGIPIGSDACQRGRILSSYEGVTAVTGEQKKLWIITEWNRSVTTILLPSDY